MTFAESSPAVVAAKLLAAGFAGAEGSTDSMGDRTGKVVRADR